MNNTISILHMSDLHKDANDNYANLINSLKTDCEKYIRDEKIKKPDIVVVSGDIIQGGSIDDIKKQYAESSIFLNNIVDYFLEGNKERIIIVPGNHDIDWNASRSSMEKIEIGNNIDSVLYEFFSGSSEIRWSWSDLCFYKIIDQSIYNDRLKQFVDFYNSFFDGVKFFSIEPDEQFQLYDFPEFNIAFIGFNSCYKNDHLNYAGKINPTCITRASDELKSLNEKGRLLIGVWHHNTSGQPFENNYLDNRVLKAMIDRNIKIGLHGHQHVCGIVNEFKNVFEDKKIVLFSAGTLYGYKESLPYGTNRQYNIIEINTMDEEMQYEITIHSREDVDKSLFDIPSWDKGRIDKTSDSSWKTLINKPKEPSIIEILNNIMEETEKDGDFRSAVWSLTQLDLNNIMVRKVLCDYLERLDDDMLICELLIEPKNNAETILLMNSAIELNNWTVMEKIIQIPLIATSNDAAVKKLREYLIYQLKNHGTN